MRWLLVLCVLWPAPVFAQSASPDPTEGPTVTDCQFHVWTLRADGATLVDGVHTGAGFAQGYLFTGCQVYAVAGGTWYRAGMGTWTQLPAKPTVPVVTTPPVVTTGTVLAWDDQNPSAIVDYYDLCIDAVCVNVGKPSPPRVALPQMVPGSHVLTVRAANVAGPGPLSAPFPVVVAVAAPGGVTNLRVTP